MSHIGGAAEAMYELPRLGFQVRIRAPRDVVRELAALIPDAPPWASRPVHAQADLCLSPDSPAPGLQRMLADGETIWQGSMAQPAVPLLEWAAVQTTVRGLMPTYLLFHAGALVRTDRGLLVPGASGRGKTTLVAGLLAAGYRYCCDDVAAIDRDTLLLYPFAKSLCIKAGALDVLASRFPALRSRPSYRRFAQPRVQYLPPPAGSWPDAPVSIRYIIFPQYRPGAPTALRPLTRSAALPRLLKTLCSPAEALRADLPLLLRLLRHAECFRLTTGCLDEAMRCIEALTE